MKLSNKAHCSCGNAVVAYFLFLSICIMTGYWGIALFALICVNIKSDGCKGD